ncbi:MAG: hypothetical protein IPJ13_21120 [Saprospiraceae bacterium]|nr:hypothetical protein [Saprospiraceae bacterium]
MIETGDLKVCRWYSYDLDYGIKSGMYTITYSKYLERGANVKWKYHIDAVNKKVAPSPYPISLKIALN